MTQDNVVIAITLGIALSGLILSIMNTWGQMDQKKVKIRVVPVIQQHVDSNMRNTSAPLLGVSIVNMSAFPVVITDAGLSDSRSFSRSRRITLQMYMTPDGKPWPRKLEPRESISLSFSQDLEPSHELCTMRYAYAKTQCEYFACGTSAALKSYLDVVRKFLSDRGET